MSEFTGGTIDENLEQVKFEIEKLKNESLAEPTIYKSFEHMLPSLEKILNENINDAIFQADLKIDVIDIFLHKSFPFLKDFVEKNCISGRRIEIRLSMLDKTSSVIPELRGNWQAYSDIYQYQLDEFCKRVKEIKNANILLKISTYSYMPNWYGILIDKKYLFISEYSWDNDNNLTEN